MPSPGRGQRAWPSRRRPRRAQHARRAGAGQQIAQGFGECRRQHIGLVEPGQAGAGRAATHVDVVAPQSAPNHADLSGRWVGTAVSTSAQPDAHRLIREAPRLQGAQQFRQVALGLGHRQPAGRQGRACQGAPTQRGQADSPTWVARPYAAISTSTRGRSGRHDARPARYSAGRSGAPRLRSARQSRADRSAPGAPLRP